MEDFRNRTPAELVRMLEDPDSLEGMAILEALRASWRRRLPGWFPDLSNDVDDVIQEALCRLLAALRKRGLTPNSFWGYADRVCWNCAYDRLRRRRRSPEVPIEDITHTLFDPTPSFEDEAVSDAERDEARARDRLLLEQLLRKVEGKSYRQALKILFAYLGREGSHKEIAQHRRGLARRLGWTEVKLRKKISRWLRDLRKTATSKRSTTTPGR